MIPEEHLPASERLLCQGQITVVQELLNSSNQTFLVELATSQEQGLAIYKPERGERALWDFEPGLHRREYAAYVLSEVLGWQLVPTTVVRDDGPFGVGSLQSFIVHHPGEHYFTLYEHKPQIHDQLRRLTLFDLIANNADRKSGHVLCDQHGKIWGIDHGLCFAPAMKLRTVMWDFADEEIATELLDDVAPLVETLPEALAEQLNSLETSALQDRVQEVLDTKTYPHDVTGRRFPWPLI